MFLGLCGIVFFASWAMMVREGIWSNTINLINIALAGLIAFSFYAPLAIMIDEATGGQYTYLLDFVLIWGLFILSMLLLRIVTDKLSKTRLRLKHPLDTYGGPLVGILAAWVLMSFTMASMHTAPFKKVLLGVDTTSVRSGLTAPDMGWLSFVERVTKKEGLGGGSTVPLDRDAFVDIYANHREKLEKASGLRVKR